MKGTNQKAVFSYSLFQLSHLHVQITVKIGIRNQENVESIFKILLFFPVRDRSIMKIQSNSINELQSCKSD